MISHDDANLGCGFTIEGLIPLSKRFHRDRPAADEGPPQAWTAVEQVIDHCAALLDIANVIRPGRHVRDSVSSALLRRAVITAEGGRRCIYHSLEEPALVLMRTLIEAELNLLLVSRDETDRMAERLAAFHYLGGRRYMKKVFGSEEARARLLRNPDHRDFMQGASRRLKEYFASPAFDAVREEVEVNEHWHGYGSVEAAFRAVGGSSDYANLFSSYSPFVHASNVDFDFADIVDGRPHMKAVIQRDPERTLNMLSGIALILLRMARTYLDDKQIEKYSEPVYVTLDTGERFQISPVDALQHQVIAIFGADLGWTVGDDGEVKEL